MLSWLEFRNKGRCGSSDVSFIASESFEASSNFISHVRENGKIMGIGGVFGRMQMVTRGGVGS